MLQRGLLGFLALYRNWRPGIRRFLVLSFTIWLTLASLFSLALVPGDAFAAPTAKCPQIKSETSKAATTLADRSAKLYEYWNENARGTTWKFNDATRTQLGTRGQAVRPYLELHHAQLKQWAQNDCGLEGFNTQKRFLVETADSYNAIVALAGDFALPTPLQEYKVALIAYTAIQQNVNAAECDSILASAETNTIQARGPIRDAVALDDEIHKDLIVTPEETEAMSSRIQAARTAIKAAQDKVNEAEDKGCDKEATTKAAYDRMVSLLNPLRQQLIGIETRNGIIATSAAAQVGGTAAGVQDQLSGVTTRPECKELGKAAKEKAGSNVIFQFIYETSAVMACEIYSTLLGFLSTLATGSFAGIEAD